MSVVKNALIRPSEYLQNKGIYELFINTTDKRIPLFYQYCQTPVALEKLPEQDRIGYATNIREVDDMIVCDVELDVMKNKAKHFMGCIDNYTLKTIKNVDNDDDRPETNYKITRFVVYDKDFKQKVEEKIKNESRNQQPTGRTGNNVSMHGNRSGRKH